MKHVKAFAIILSILALFTTLSGCNSWVYEANSNNPRPNQNYYGTQPAGNTNSDEELFAMEYVGVYSHFKYYRDTITDVLYIKYESGQAAGLTVMLDPETGLPLTYTRYMEMANQDAS